MRKRVESVRNGGVIRNKWMNDWIVDEDIAGSPWYRP
jgi:hypothetical protein